MNKLQAVDLEILKEIVRVCDETNLVYYIIGGTLLGAIRHKGFIPWDDDIDLGMPRNDYEIFLKIAPSIIQSNLQLVNYKIDEKYQYYITRVLDTNTKVVEKRIGNNSKYTYASVDLFPLDGSPNNVILRQLYYFKVMFYRAIMSLCYNDSIDKDRIRSKKEILLLYFLTKIPMKKFFNPFKIKSKIDKIMRNYKVSESKLIGCLMGAYRIKEMVPKNIYGKGKYYEFENIVLRGPEYYDKFLFLIYGDYMKLPAEDDRKVHFELLDKMN